MTRYALFLLLATTTATAADKDELFIAKPLTEKNSFTPGIEGPCCDAGGNVYVVNLKKNGDIAKDHAGRQDRGVRRAARARASATASCSTRRA